MVQKRKKFLNASGWVALVLVPILVFLSVFVFFNFIGRPYIIHGQSMFPTLHDGDRVYVNTYRGDDKPSRGDIVVLKNVAGLDDLLIKRVIATGGDSIKIDKNKIVVNGTDTYTNSNHGSEVIYSKVIPENYIYVMGDNESVSYDSRSFGFVPCDRVVGKAIFVFWPLSDFRIF
ncbi:MAG: signal peptidase I [Actinomycetota bacterium]|nr:signal peptidase I [Actinomycetota bacterium]